MWTLPVSSQFATKGIKNFETALSSYLVPRHLCTDVPRVLLFLAPLAPSPLLYPGAVGHHISLGNCCPFVDIAEVLITEKNIKERTIH